jgi:RNA polymerase sigma factor (sigma-70 family)
VAELAGEDGREWADRLSWAAGLRGALAQLHAHEREAIEMAYFQGYTRTEISKALDIPLGTVKSRSSRALKHLAAILTPSQ